MLGSIIIGAGVDYAVHFLSAWRAAKDAGVEAGMTQAVEDTAPAIWTNALMVSAGFFVLTLGEARPLQNVGGLTSAAMLVAAVMTFVAIPVLARKVTYSRLNSRSI
ncbi:MAG: MMPL family transporter [Proteobacteria bacterium]|nr:MMPL family transporter [Pseudomonadota bacterium]